MVIRKVLKEFRPVVDRIADGIGYKQSDLKIRSDAHRFWDDSSAKNFGVNSHWRGHGIFENDDERWLSVRQRHLTKFERMALLADTPPVGVTGEMLFDTALSMLREMYQE